MGNDVTNNPYILDTADASALTDYRIFVKSVRWVNATTSGHTAVIQDKDGVEKWASVAAGSEHVEADLIEEWWDGILMKTLSSGKIYISFI